MFWFWSFATLAGAPSAIVADNNPELAVVGHAGVVNAAPVGV